MKTKNISLYATTLGKDIARFSPVWGLYTVFLGTMTLFFWRNASSSFSYANIILQRLSAMGTINLLYAFLAAAVLFGDLFKSRLAGALHALPMRREGWFLTHTAAGLLFSLVPNLLVALVNAGLMQQYNSVAFSWLAVMTLQYLFFFGLAAFSVQCAGNLLGTAAVYAIVNLLSAFGGWLFTTFYQPLMYGVQADQTLLTQFSPILQFSKDEYLGFHYDHVAQLSVFDGPIAQEWTYLGIVAGIGLILLALSLLLYRKRQLERAGDLLAFRPIGPVFLVLLTLFVGAALYTVPQRSAEKLGYVFLVIGFALAFFLGSMLMERSLKVFRWKKLLAFGILTAAFLLSVKLTAVDALGVVSYIPKTDRVASATLSLTHYDYDREKKSVTLTDPASIDTLRQIHQTCIDEPVTDYMAQISNQSIPVYICYQLESGATLERYYYLLRTGESARAVQDFVTANR